MEEIKCKEMNKFLFDLKLLIGNNKETIKYVVYNIERLEKRLDELSNKTFVKELI